MIESSASTSAVVLEVAPIDRRFWPRGLWARRTSKKRDALAISGNALPKGDPAALPKGDRADVTRFRACSGLA
jgi:hypothetical protein